MTEPQYWQLVELVGDLKAEAERCAQSHAYFAATVFLTSAIEAVLVATVTSFEDVIRKARAWPIKERRHPMTWKLETLLEVAFKMEWLPKNIPGIDTSLGGLLTDLKRLRNSIHPGRYIQDFEGTSIGETQFEWATEVFGAAMQQFTRLTAGLIPHAFGEFGTTMNTAAMLERMGDRQNALSLYTAALEWAEAHAESEEYLIPLIEIVSEAQSRNGYIDASIVSLRRAISIGERCIGRNSEEVLGSMNRLANVLINAQQYDEAEATLADAMKRAVAGFGHVSSNVATVFNNLGLVCYWRQDYAEAESRYTSAKEIDLELGGSNLEKIPTRLLNIAQCAIGLEEFERARTSLETAVELCETQPDLPSLYADLLGVLAAVERQLGNKERVRELLEKSLWLDGHQFGPKSRGVAISLSNLALHLSEQGEHETALEYLDESLYIAHHQWGDVHSETAVRLCNKAYVLDQLSRKTEAIAMLNEALTMYQRLGDSESASQIMQLLGERYET